MYKSIIFDIGGVLVDFDPKAYLVDRLCNAEMEEKVYDLTFGSEEWQWSTPPVTPPTPA